MDPLTDQKGNIGPLKKIEFGMVAKNASGVGLSKEEILRHPGTVLVFDRVIGCRLMWSGEKEALIEGVEAADLLGAEYRMIRDYYISVFNRKSDCGEAIMSN